MPTADELLGDAVAAELLDALQAADRGNPFAATRAAVARLRGQPLGDRARSLAAGLVADTGHDHARLARVVRAAYEDPALAGWHVWPVTHALATTGVQDPDPRAFDDALDLMAHLTPRLTSEFALRLLLRHDTARVLERARRWTGHEDEHVRRLASEGTRPRLPWGLGVPVLTADPQLTRPLLDALHDDASEHVRRSVANHLNDHGRLHPGFAVEVAGGWLASAHGPRTVRHALRGLVKKGHPGALELLGFGAVRVRTSPLEVTPRVVAIGGDVTFRATLENLDARPAEVAVDHVLTFPGARGGQRSKTFTLTRLRLAPGEVAEVRGTHSFRQLSTRTHVPGPASLALQVNGVRQPATGLTLV
ncbi:DNA alkylation repair protein [Kineococcus sp. SYSU DK001]|uniref:DNA alkylation repair protein n=1 Tax=Kineococcus sp. SYSU DK001 TaxID=3383122 RepID=UPI003D7C9565